MAMVFGHCTKQISFPSLVFLQLVAAALLGWSGVEGQGQRCETQADCTGGRCLREITTTNTNTNQVQDKYRQITLVVAEDI